MSLARLFFSSRLSSDVLVSATIVRVNTTQNLRYANPQVNDNMHARLGRRDHIFGVAAVDLHRKR